MPSFFIGIDIQLRRNCSYAVIDHNGILVESGWFSDPEVESLHLAKKFSASGHTEIGIDAPRVPLRKKRTWYWDGKRKIWKQDTNRSGYGRHCEIVLSAHRIANPQWTPLADEAPQWMNLGFKLFSALQGIVKVHEVFPSASYSLLSGICNVRLTVDFSSCRPGPKDMLDAWVAASTIREYVNGRGCEVGGGDGLGTIILPRPLPGPIIEEVLKWPDGRQNLAYARHDKN